MYMRPIPKRLLIHQVMLHKEKDQDRWGKGQLDAGVQLEFVRMEPSRQIIRDKNNAEVQLAATLFYDCTNSRPMGLSFQEDDIIIFNGQKHQVRSVEPLYDERRLHHYELGMVRYGKN